MQERKKNKKSNTPKKATKKSIKVKEQQLDSSAELESSIVQESTKSIKKNEKEENKVLGVFQLDNSKNNESYESVSI